MADVAHPVFDYLDGGAAAGRDPGPGFQTSVVRVGVPRRRRRRHQPARHYLLCGPRRGPPARAGRGWPPPLGAKVAVVSGEPHTPGHHYRVVRLADAITRSAGPPPCSPSPRPPAPERRRAARRRRRDPLAHDVERRRRQILRQASVAGRACRVRPRRPDGRPRHSRRSTRSTASARMGLDRGRGPRHVHAVRRTAELRPTPASCTTAELAPRFGTSARSPTSCRTASTTTPSSGPASPSACAAGRRRRTVPHRLRLRLAHPPARLRRPRRAARRRDARPPAHATGRVPARPSTSTSSLMFDDLRDQVEWRDIVPISTTCPTSWRASTSTSPRSRSGTRSARRRASSSTSRPRWSTCPPSPRRRGRSAGRSTTGVTGFLADGPDEWRVDAREARRRPRPPPAAWPGRRARPCVFTYGPERRAQRIKAVLDQVLDNGSGGADAFAARGGPRAAAPAVAPPALAPVRTVFEHDRRRPSQVTVVGARLQLRRHGGRGARLGQGPDARGSRPHRRRGRLARRLAGGRDAPGPSRTPTASTACSCCRTSTTPGLACTRNRGFEEADTPYVLPLDADNVLLPECAARLLDELQPRARPSPTRTSASSGPTSTSRRQELVMGHTDYTPGRLAGDELHRRDGARAQVGLAAAGGYRLGLLGLGGLETLVLVRRGRPVRPAGPEDARPLPGPRRVDAAHGHPHRVTSSARPARPSPTCTRGSTPTRSAVATPCRVQPVAPSDPRAPVRATS